MIKVKIIGAYGNENILEEEVNKFLSSIDETIEIQYQMSSSSEEVLFSVLILYRV